VTVLVVGSVALDSVETPFGRADDVLGGSATFFSASASHFTPVQLVGVVGDDYPLNQLDPLSQRGVDLSGLERATGSSFRWRGRYRHDLNAAETLETHLGVFSRFSPKIPQNFRSAPFVFLGNIDPRLQLDVLKQVEKPTLVACDTMNFWIEGKRDALLELLRRVKQLNPAIKTKSGLMLGLGETHEELFDVFADLLDHGCDFLTVGQYLQPAQDKYLPVVRYVPPEEFRMLGEKAKCMGFKQVASGPFVRSSYHARDMAEMVS
jgi:hypothetical protein